MQWLNEYGQMNGGDNHVAWALGRERAKSSGQMSEILEEFKERTRTHIAAAHTDRHKVSQYKALRAHLSRTVNISIAQLS